MVNSQKVFYNLTYTPKTSLAGQDMVCKNKPNTCAFVQCMAKVRYQRIKWDQGWCIIETVPS